MNWYKKASKLDIPEATLKRFAMLEKLREEYIKGHPQLTAGDIDTIRHGHGVYHYACGHEQRCRCTHGGNFKIEVPFVCYECDKE